MHRLQTINGATYTFDPESGAIFFGEADADAFTYNDGVTYLSACGCAAEAGCQCRRTVYRTMYTPPDTPTKTPPSEIRAGVERVRREMAAEREGREVGRRARNEIARSFKYLRQVPVTNGYSAALARLHGPAPEVDIYKDGPVPNGYSIALAKRGISPEVWGTTGDEPPDGYAIALAKRRKEA